MKSMHMKKIASSRVSIFYLVTILCIPILLISCKKFVEIPPPKTEITSETVFSNDASAISTLRGIYSMMASNQNFMNGELERFTGLSCDELDNYSSNAEQQQFYLPKLAAVNNIVYNVFWREAYKYIHNANGILEAAGRSVNLSAPVLSQLKGEAKFIRAICHFYLAGLFGNVPYVTTTDYRINSKLPRASLDQVYNGIIEDLLDSEELLAEDFSTSQGKRNQPNKGAAQALLARVYLYMANWPKAEEYSTKLINNNSYSLSANLSQVFMSGSSETIWQIEPNVPGVNTMQGRLFILTNTPVNAFGKVALNANLVNAFEAGDQRRTQWVNSFVSGTNTWYYAYKYKKAFDPVVTEFSIILRLAEQYLIRSEARAQQNNISGAQSDLNMIRNRAFGMANPTMANDKPSLLLAIEEERKFEFFAEGHRWLDLKRTGRAQVLLAGKPDWQDTDLLYPIPQQEILINSNLSQNPGY